MTIARIDGGTIAEIRDIPLDDVPEHKRQHWLPVEGDKPSWDSRISTLSGPTYQIEQTRVVRAWAVLPLSDAAIMAAFGGAIQTHIDQTAQSRSYQDGVALTSYASSTNPSWAAEAQAFIAWRDQVWVYAHTELSRVLAGERDRPTLDGFLSELQPMSWPE